MPVTSLFCVLRFLSSVSLFIFRLKLSWEKEDNSLGQSIKEHCPHVPTTGIILEGIASDHFGDSADRATAMRRIKKC
jgi:hypothetical protein